MHAYHMRYDILISMGAAFLAAWGVGKGVDLVTAMNYSSYVEEHTVAENEVGGMAGEDIFRAQRIEDLLSHENFTIVYEDLGQSENFLNQIQHGYPLDRTDFYVDMKGMGGVASLEDYQEYKKMPFQIAAFFLVFPLFHALGSRLGVFPYFFEPREKKRKSDWD